jgi:hypothetical protein
MNWKFVLGGMPVIVLAFSAVFMGCASKTPAASASSVPDIPEIDYSLIGPNDSVIIAYIDPLLVKTFKPTDNKSIQKEMMTFVVHVDSTRYTSSTLVNIKYLNMKIVEDMLEAFRFSQSCQMQIPNGAHTLHVETLRSLVKSDILPFEAAFDNVAITYKIRLATNEEKQAGRIGLGNEVYTLEEVSQRKLR